MNIIFKAFGLLQTNCYLIDNGINSIIVDPGEGSSQWIFENIRTKVIAIINTHGHYDHVYSNHELKEALNIPLIINKEDSYLLSADQFSIKFPPSFPNITFFSDSELKLNDFNFKAIHLPGHTRGTTIYDFGNFIFSGDFVMKDTVGRYDLPTSNKEQQHLSLKKYFNYYKHKSNKSEVIVYSGHGQPFTLDKSLEVVNKWLSFF